MTVSNEIRELLEYGNELMDRRDAIIDAKTKDCDSDKIKLSRLERARLCTEFKLGFWAITEDGVIQWQSIPCKEWDLCSNCREYEASKRKSNLKHNANKMKKDSNSKTRLKKGVPADKVASYEKKIKRHGGRFISIEGEEKGTKDIIIEMEDDANRAPEQMNDIYGNEIEIDDYDFEAALVRQKKRGGKRMAGKLAQVSSIGGPKKENTERVRLPKFRVEAGKNDQVKEIAKEILPIYQVTTFEQYQGAIYDMAERFAARLDEENIIYDVKMDFRNVELEQVTARWNLLAPLPDECPDNSTIESDEVNQTFQQEPLSILGEYYAAIAV